MDNFPRKETPLAFLQRSTDKHPGSAAARAGIILGICSTSFCTAFLLVVWLFLPIPEWGKSAAAHIGEMSQFGIFLVAIIFAPLFETLVGQLLPIELARYVRANKFVCVLAGGAVFGIGHFANGGVIHGLTTFIAGCVFSFAYVTLREPGVRPAFIAAATAHAVHNGLLIFVLEPLSPSLA